MREFVETAAWVILIEGLLALGIYRLIVWNKRKRLARQKSEPGFSERLELIKKTITDAVDAHRPDNEALDLIKEALKNRNTYLENKFEIQKEYTDLMLDPNSAAHCLRPQPVIEFARKHIPEWHNPARGIFYNYDPDYLTHIVQTHLLRKKHILEIIALLDEEMPRYLDAEALKQRKLELEQEKELKLEQLRKDHEFHEEAATLAVYKKSQLIATKNDYLEIAKGNPEMVEMIHDIFKRVLLDEGTPEV